MLWIVERTEERRFPYRLQIRKGEDTVLCLKVQERWPGPRGQIFCIRDQERAGTWNVSEEVERVPVISLRRYGKRLAVVLDRASKKRCDFLFLKKQYKSKEGEYEQIFWRTQKALMERRPRVKLTAKGDLALQIAVDINERYPWRFVGCKTTREKLPVGDYALKDEEGILAVIERKSMDNLLQDFGNMPVLHQKLGELEAYAHAALVVEASYSDFLDPKRVTPYRPSFTGKALGELFAFHPRFQIIFAGNRKLANEWVLRFFAAILSHERDEPHPVIREAAAAYGVLSSFRGGGYYEVVRTIGEMPATFTFAMLRAEQPNVQDHTIRRALGDLKKAGKIISHPAGIKSYWEKTIGSKP